MNSYDIIYIFPKTTLPLQCNNSGVIMSLNIKEIRKDFPILSRKIRGKRLVYFDNAATSQKPIQVINAIKRFYEEFNANIHRGLHTLSQESSELYETAHDIVAEFINASGREEVVFVRNTSEALNLVAMTLGFHTLSKGDEIIISIMEHHSNILPWSNLAKRVGAKLKIIDITPNYMLNMEMLEEALSEKTKIVAITHMSNVLGTINDIKRISKIAHEYDAFVVVDGAQSVPHMPIDVKDLGIDFLAFSGHKMLGPTGIGVLYAKKEILEDIPPFLLGGDMIREVHCDLEGNCWAKWNDLPWKFEAGTPNIVGGVGLAEAIKYLKRIGMNNVRNHEMDLTGYALQRLNEEIGDQIIIYGPKEIEVRGGIIAFNLVNMDPHVVALYLDEYGIAVRSGFHCAQPLHERLNLKNGSVRASFYIYNTHDEIDYFVNALKEILRKQNS